MVLHSVSPKPISDCRKGCLSSRSSALLVLPKLRLSNHHKNMPYIGLKICSSLELLEKDKLIYWKHTRVKKRVKSFFLKTQTLLGTKDWYPINFNIFEVEANKSAGFLHGESDFF